MNWFRWYTGTATDPKFLVVARLSKQNVASVVAVWAMLLERASDGVTQCDAGVTRCDAVKRGFVTGFDCESADVLLGLEDGSSAAIIEALRTKGLLDGDKVTAWEKRQPKREDSSAERTRAYRERLKEKQSETQRDAGVTQCDARREENREILNTPLDTSLRSVSIPQGGAREKQPRPRFIPPTVGEVRDYCESRGNTVDPQAFVDFYESNGWRVGKNAMRDWRAAVRTWEAKRKAEAQPLPVRRSAEEERRAHNDAVCQRAYERWTGRQEQGVFDV